MNIAVRLCAFVAVVLVGAVPMGPAAAHEVEPLMVLGSSHSVDGAQGVTATIEVVDSRIAGATATLVNADVQAPAAAIGEPFTLGLDTADGAFGQALVTALSDAPAIAIDVAAARLDGATAPQRAALVRLEAGKWVGVASAWDASAQVLRAQTDRAGTFAVVERDESQVPVIAIDLANDADLALWDADVVREHEVLLDVAQQVETYVESVCMADVVVTRAAGEPVVSRDLRAAMVDALEPYLALTLDLSSSDGFTSGGEDVGAPRVLADAGLARSIVDEIAAHTGREGAVDRTLAGGLEVGAPYALVELGAMDASYDRAVLERRPDLYALALAKAVIEELDAGCGEPGDSPERTIAPRMSAADLPTVANPRLPRAWFNDDNVVAVTVNGQTILGRYTVGAGYPSPENSSTTINVYVTWSVYAGEGLPEEDMPGVGDEFWDSPISNPRWRVSYGTETGGGDSAGVPPSEISLTGTSGSHFTATNRTSSTVQFRQVPGDWDGVVRAGDGSIVWSAPWADPVPPGGGGGGGEPEPTLPEVPSQALLELFKTYGLEYTYRFGGDPVNLSTGAMAVQEKVFELTGVGDQVIDLTLSHNGGDDRVTPLGIGWNFAYSAWAQEYDGGSVLITGADGSANFFEADGDEFIARAGARATLERTDDGVALTRVDGTVQTFVIDPDTGFGFLDTMVDRQGNAYSFEYGTLPESDGDLPTFAPLQSITDEAGQSVEVEATPQGRITAFVHPDGRRWELEYTEDRLSAITDGADRTRSFAYTDDGLLETVTGADGVVEITNDYDADGRVVSQVDGVGSERTFAYDGDITTLTDALGHESVVEHNEEGFAERSIDAEGGVTLTEYDENRNPTVSVDARGNDHVSSYDDLGRVLTFTNAVGETTTYAYNDRGDLTRIEAPAPDGATAVTEFVLNDDGRAIETHRPDGTVTYATYDEHGDTLSMTDANGNVTEFEYDDRGNVVRVTDAEGGETVSTYDLANRLLSTTDARGAVTTYEYDFADNLLSVTDAEGGVTAYTYDVNGSVLSETDPLGRVTAYEYNANLQLTGVEYPDGTTESREYDLEHRLVRVVNRDGTEQTFEYDRLGRATARTDELGQEWATAYDATGNPITAVDPASRTVTTEYDELGRPVATTDPLGHTTRTEYTPGGQVAATVDQAGHRTEFTYDVLGRLIEVEAPDGTTTTYAHDDNGNVTATVDQRGFTTEYAFDGLDRQVGMTDARGGEWTTAYDAVGNVIKTVDPRGAVTATEYDLLGRPVAITDAEGATTTLEYDAAGQLLSTTDPLNRTTAYEYDPMGRPTVVTHPDGTTTVAEYDAMGRIVSTADARGEMTTFEYDALGRQISLTDAAGGTWLTEYDVMGNVVESTDALGRVTVTEYDAAYRQVAIVDADGGRTETDLDPRGLVIATRDAPGRETTVDLDVMGRVTAMVAPDGAETSYEYDAAGNLTELTDPRGFATVTQYDELGRPVAITDAENGTWRTEYDATGNVVATVDAEGARSTTVFDLVGRPTVQTDALGGTTTTVYDAAGQVTSVTDARGHATSFDYDALGRVSATAYPDGSTESFEYFATGELAQRTDQRGNDVVYAVDELGRETSRVDEAGETWLTEHDAVGNVTATVDPLGGRTETEFDALNRPVAVTNALGETSTTAYSPTSTVTARTDALGHTTSYAYDAMDRVVAVTSPEGDVTEFGYDLAGNATSVTDARGFTVTTDYDGLGRPTVVTDPDGGTTVTAYDAVGRVVAVTDANGDAETWGYDALGRTAAHTDGEGFATTFRYDAVGNLLAETSPRGGVTEYVYDSMNRPTAVTNAEGEVTAIAYDAAGNVTSSTDPAGVVTRFTYDPRGLLTRTVENADGSADADADSNVTTTVQYDARGVVVSTTDPRGGTTEHVLDALGRVVESADAAGRVTGSTYDAAGRVVEQAHADGTVTGFEYSADGDLVATDYADQRVSYETDAVGNRTSMTDELGTSAWVFDWAGRVVSDTDARGNTHIYGYDAAGNQTRVEYADGRVLEREFDGRGLMVSQSAPDGVTAFVWDGDGNLSEVARPSGVTTTTEHDLMGRVTSIVHAGGVPEGVEADAEVSPASEAPGNAFGHCNDAPGHDNQQPTGCWSGELTFAYDYEDRGLISERTVTTDEAQSVTAYEHDSLGRLTESVSGDYVATYGWDASSNLIAESVSDDVATNLADDGWQVTRSVNAVNQVESVVTDVRLPEPHTTTQTLEYDSRGNRTGSVTTTQSGGKTHTSARIDYVFDGMDQVVSVHDHGANLNNAKDDAVTSWTRDGLGRGLTVTVNGEARERVFDGTAMILDGGTELVYGPDGRVLTETFQTVEGKGKHATTVTTSRDVLADVLGSAVAVATDGVIDADLNWFGDFGEILDASVTDTVTGFAGRIDTAGLSEFATRAYDPVARVWLQEDSYPGTVTRASSQNRYAYVEGAPETFTDFMGAWRAANAARLQELTAVDYATFMMELATELARIDMIVGLASLSDSGTVVRPDGMVCVVDNLACLDGFENYLEWSPERSEGFGDGYWHPDYPRVSDCGPVECKEGWDLFFTMAGLAVATVAVEVGGPALLSSLLARAGTRAAGSATTAAVRGTTAVDGVVSASPTTGRIVVKQNPESAVGQPPARPSGANDVAGAGAGAAREVPPSSNTAGANTTPANVNAGAASTTARGWRVGDPIENLTKAGDSPAWSTVRARYWKNVANDALEGEYSVSNLARMQAGKPPLHDELGVPMELNHIIPRSQGGSHALDNLEPLWPWEHAAVDPYRFYTGPTP